MSTIRSLSRLLILSTVAGCGPMADGGTTDASATATGTSGGTAGSMSVDAGGAESPTGGGAEDKSGAADEGVAETGDPGPVTDATGSGADAGADTESTDGTTGGSAIVPSGGRYLLTGSRPSVEPAGCAAGKGDDSPWELELELPPRGTAFEAIETFAAFVTTYECTLVGVGFDCSHQTIVDYGDFGSDALVQLDTTYTATWVGDGELSGTYDAAFACEGTACDSVAPQWNLESFPCTLGVPFVGLLEPGS